MIKLFLIPLAVILSCGSVKKNRSAEKKDSASVTTTVTDDLHAKDGVIPATTIDTAPVKTKKLSGVPDCIKKKMDTIKTAPKHEQAQRIIEYTYKGKKVYYVQQPCCDFFNLVYDDKCNLIGAPDGGFTGRGDGKLPDFFKEAKDEKVIWEIKQ